MGTLIYQNAKIWLAEYNFSSDMNSLNINYGADGQDDTAFGDSTKSQKGGMKTISLEASGFMQDGDDTVGKYMFDNIAVAQRPLTVAAIGADGDGALSFLAHMASFAPGGAVGEMYKFSVSANAEGDLIRGTIMFNSVDTTNGVGTARQLGAVSASQSMYATLHVLTVSGGTPTLDVTIDSDDNAGMTSSVTRGTFAQKIAIGSQWLTPIAGAITDDYWQVNYTIGGSTPSFTFVVFIGIQ